MALNPTEPRGRGPILARSAGGRASELLPGPRSIDPFRGKRRLSRVENLAGSSQRRSFCPFPSLFRGSGKGTPVGRNGLLGLPSCTYGFGVVFGIRNISIVCFSFQCAPYEVTVSSLSRTRVHTRLKLEKSREDCVGVTGVMFILGMHWVLRPQQPKSSVHL